MPAASAASFRFVHSNGLHSLHRKRGRVYYRYVLLDQNCSHRPAGWERQVPNSVAPRRALLQHNGNVTSPYYNLPPEQIATQRLVDLFNADERLWTKLGPKRRARRKLRPRLSRRKLKRLDLLEFAKAKPPQDCIGQWLQP